ncbi:hypothetical protein HYH03_006465 [Edaphochlamys debaryana]|uniref:Uncharacterized protein n=1 Tax=Edaphochlamys debaryana TaxID=47281 RepID=A0A836C146_9CHLO|nr:hypothetical protein HYH03_006465 [Edaphochlamys debaryana]|eukprot:KAG2495522.1 hypothetical protein HYH03_006465 [Edaphochlamys debaryana]
MVAGLLPLSTGVLLALAPALATESTGEEFSAVIGIDLGATHASVGVYHNSRTQVIANALGSRVTPAYMAFADTGRLAGEAARDRALLDPKRTVYGVKHLLGRTFDDPEVQRLRDLVPYDIVEQDGKPYISVEMNGEHQVHSPEEILAMVLALMKETAESFLGTTVKHTVITVPAHFTDAQRQATKVAGTLAGLNVLRIINEPSAAVIAHGLDKKGGEYNYLVFHLGGGTLDVSVIFIDNGVIEILSSAGDPHLGGEDFTRRVVDHFVGVVRKKYGRDVSGDARAMQKLWREAERAKRTLSALREVRVEVPGLTEGVDLSEPLSRARFAELNRDLFESAVGAIGKALEAAEVNKSEIIEILMVGGSSRIPRIRDLVKEWFDGKEPVRAEGIEPDEAVTHGAAEQGGILSGAMYIPERPILATNIAVMTMGIETTGGLMTTFIPRWTILPPSKRTKVFSTEEDSQETVIVEVYEGERSLARDNHWLGQIELRGIPPGPRGVPRIEVTFVVAYEGNMTVTAKDLDTGREEKIEIHEKEGRPDWDEIEHRILEANAFAEQDQVVRAQIEARNRLTGHCYSVESAVQDATQDDHLREEDTDQMSAAVREALDWLETNPGAGPEDTKARYQALAHACRPILAERLAAGPATGLVGPLETAAPEPEGGMAIPEEDEGNEDSFYYEPYPGPGHEEL